ncbi:hypothetical protein ACFQY0_18550 [Haloferula chungangensis]|uniref:Molecular chaperone n=1 Tax=Haloferula chungangensis TaxID=1048331 RepID=A0ABW2LEI8_9BACT
MLRSFRRPKGGWMAENSRNFTLPGEIRWIDVAQPVRYGFGRMIGHRILITLAILLGFAASASSQVTVDLKFPKSSYLHGENVLVAVSITNMSGQDLVFQGSEREPWIDFMVNSGRGVPLTPVARPAFGVVKIPAGKTVARSVELNKLYSLNDLGNYSVYAIVRPPGRQGAGFQSQRHLFTVSTAKPYWSQVVGVPGKAGQSREYRLIQFTGGRKLMLYVQVADAKTGHVLRTHGLGESLFFRKPTITVDGALTMHVLYLATPEIWGHVRVNPDGEFLGRDLFKNSEYGDPSLIKLQDGTVRVNGGIPYDPKAEAEREAQSRKASDRPAFIYE